MKNTTKVPHRLGRTHTGPSSGRATKGPTSPQRLGAGPVGPGVGFDRTHAGVPDATSSARGRKGGRSAACAAPSLPSER